MIRSSLIPAAAACALMAVPAHAQPAESGGIASLIVSAATVENHVKVGIAGEIGYRFNRTLGVTLELTSLPSFNPDLAEPVPSPIPYTIATTSGPSAGGSGSLSSVFIPAPTVTFEDQKAHATIFTGNLRLEIPTASRRLLPYVVGGAGVAHVQDEFTVRTTYAPNSLSGLPSTIVIPSFPSIATDAELSSLDMAVLFGGGLGLRAAEHMTINADLRYLAVLGARDLQIGRFGVGISYRF